MPLTLRARTLLQWNSHLGSTYIASPRRRKALGWQFWGYAYSLACLLFFDRMLLVCCNLSCSETFIMNTKKHGTKDSCQSSGSTVSELCDCLKKLENKNEQRKRLLERYHLEFCDILPFGKHLASFNADQCPGNLKRILKADCNASQYYSKFVEDIVSRIDCADRYSVRWKCTDCKEAYKEWLCTSQVLPHMLSNGKSACTTGACIKVLKRCPYFLPNSESQWSGQSVFECPDSPDSKDSKDCIKATLPMSDQKTSSQTSISKSHDTNGS